MPNRKTLYKVQLLILALVLLVGLSYSPAYAEHETITPGDTATGITLTVRKPVKGNHAGAQATRALVTVEDNTVNFADDGATPTAEAGTNVGHQMSPGQSIWLPTAEQVNNFKVIDRVSGSVGVVKVTTYF